MPSKRYENMDGVHTIKSFGEIRRWQKERRAKVKDLFWQVPSADKLETDRLAGNRSAASLTWIGHATFLVQLGGLNIVTDPVWAGRMGFAKRLAPPGMEVGRMPPVDVIVISHGHYDHLHIGSLRALARGRKLQPLLLVPEGLGSMLRRKGFTRVEEFAWWEKREFSGVGFTFVPAQHWTRRTLRDMNTSHWGGWVMEGGGTSVYFAGDSGYFRGFADIGARFPGLGAVLMPIGAYEPEWFMGGQHVTPEEAVKAYLDMGCSGPFIPMHYGAFRLADDTPREALDRLCAEWERLGLPPERLAILRHGETLWENFGQR